MKQIEDFQKIEIWIIICAEILEIIGVELIEEKTRRKNQRNKQYIFGI